MIMPSLAAPGLFSDACVCVRVRARARACVCVCVELHPSQLEVEVKIASLTPLTFASHPLDESTHLLMPLWSVEQWAGEPRGAEGQALAWVTSDELGEADYAMPPADYPLVPIVRRAMITMDT